MSRPEIYDEVAYCYDGTLEGLLSAIFASYRTRRTRSTSTRAMTCNRACSSA